MATFDKFQQLDIRAGTVVDAQPFPKARKPAYQLRVDFGGELGVKATSAQITELYSPEALVGRQVLGAVNFPPMRIAGFVSEVLVLGLYTDDGVVLIQPDRPVDNGSKLG